MNKIRRGVVVGAGILTVLATSTASAQQVVRPALQPPPVVQPAGATYLIGPPAFILAAQLQARQDIIARQLEIRQAILAQQLEFGRVIRPPFFSGIQSPWRFWHRF